jgi:hypothetical protein
VKLEERRISRWVSELVKRYEEEIVTRLKELEASGYTPEQAGAIVEKESKPAPPAVLKISQQRSLRRRDTPLPDHIAVIIGKHVLDRIDRVSQRPFPQTLNPTDVVKQLNSKFGAQSA